MLNTAAKQERQEIARKRLEELRNRGFQYVTTIDEGNTWVATESPGLEIAGLLHSGFIGEVRTDDSLVAD